MSINDGKAEEGVPLRGGEGPSAPQGEENHKIITPVLAVHLLILIGITAAERVALKVMIDRMDQYLYFILQLIAFIYVPLFFCAVAYKKRYTADITADIMAFPKSKLLVMAVLDTLSSMIVLFAGSKVSGPVMTILMQGVIPATMVASRLIMKVKYHTLHYVGSAVIFAGVVITMIPDFEDDDAKTNAWYALFFLSSCIPMALSGVYKEISLKSIDMDIYYLNAWVALFQFGCGLPLAPLAAWMNGIAVSEMPSNVADGLRCAITASIDVDLCRVARNATFLYFAINILFNVYMLQVMKLGSTVVMYGSSTIAVPLSAVLFTIRPLVGISYERFSGWDVAGLVILSAGIVVYRIKPEGGGETGGDGAANESLLVSNGFTNGTKTREGSVDSDLGIDGTPLIRSYLPPTEPGDGEAKGQLVGDL